MRNSIVARGTTIERGTKDSKENTNKTKDDKTKDKIKSTNKDKSKEKIKSRPKSTNPTSRGNKNKEKDKK
jgi:hypothetical protein